MTAAMEDVPSSATTTAGGSGNDTYQVDATEHPSHRLFQAVVEQDYDSLTRLFAINARNSIVSFMSMKSRWARQQDSMAKSGTLNVVRFILCSDILMHACSGRQAGIESLESLTICCPF